MKYFLLLISSVVLLASCDKQTVTVPENRTDQLRGSNTTMGAEGNTTKWKVVDGKILYKTELGVDTVLDGFITDCRKDDYFLFFQDFQGMRYTGDNKCYTNEGNEYGFRYEFLNNENTLALYDIDPLLGEGLRNVNGKIGEFSGSKFDFSYRVLLPAVLLSSEDSGTVKITFEKY
jgi:hypothetical protein